MSRAGRNRSGQFRSTGQGRSGRVGAGRGGSGRVGAGRDGSGRVVDGSGRVAGGSRAGRGRVAVAFNLKQILLGGSQGKSSTAAGAAAAD